MVIQCESCQTEFNLDASLIKKEGTSVRCSRCHHVFKAYPPSPALPDDKDERSEISEDAVSNDDERADEVVSEEGIKQKDEDDIAVELDSDLDLIYHDVFSGDDRDTVREKTGSEDAFDDPFRGPGRDEEAPAEGPPAVFPGMDAPEPGQDIFESKEPLKKTTKEAAERAPDSPKKSSRPVLIVILFVVLGVAAAYYVWKADLMPPSMLSLLNPSSETKKAPDSGARLLQFGSVNGAFVDTENSGPLFVIRGMVTNKYPQIRRYIKIKGSILNNKGVVVLSKTVYAGNTFSEEELKTLPLDEIIKAADNRDGMAEQNLNVASGANIPFMVVFAELPKDLSEFTVEGVSSSPGS
ncbi:conserved domain protein [delta proteobacterium NaphS2]|nr:conserved domain protein [delta proteobacterium NaphS2]